MACRHPKTALINKVTKFLFSVNDVDNNQTGRPKQEEQWQEGLYDIMNEALDPMCLYPPPGIDIENPVYLSPEINDYNEVLANQILANQISYKPEHHQYVQRNRIKKQNTTNQPTLKAVTSMAQQLHLAAQVLEYIDKQQAADMFTGIHKTHEDFGSQRKTNFQRSRRPMAGSKGRNMKKSQVPKRSNSQPVFQNRKNLQQNIPVTKKLSYTTRIRGDDSNQVFTPDQYQRYMQEYVNEFDSSLSSKRMLNKVSPYTGPMSPYANELLRLAHLNLAGNHSNRPHPHNPAPPRSRKPTHSGIRSRNYRRVTLNQGATPVTPWVNK